MKITFVKIKNCAALLYLGTLTACGSPVDQHDAERPNVLATALSLGRRVGSPLTVEDEGSALALSGNFISKAQIETVNGAPRHVLFDTRAATDAFDLTQLPEAAENVARTIFDGYVAKSWELVRRKDTARVLPNGSALVSFAVNIAGMPVRDGTVDVYFSRGADGTYRLAELSSRHATVSEAGLDKNASLDTAALTRLGIEAPRYEIKNERAFIFARSISTDIYTYEVATEVDALDNETGEKLTVTLSGMDGGTIVEAFSDRVHANGVNASVFPRSYRDTKAVYPLAFATLTAGGENIALDALGQSTKNFVGAATLQLNSSRVVIGTRANPYTLTLDADQDGIEALTPAGADLNAVNTYTVIHKVNSFTRRHLTETDAEILSLTVPTRLDVEGSCNAYYTNTTINLYRAGGGCSNMAVVNDVIAHEWGHGLDDYTGTAGGISDGAFSEGIGDIIAGYLSNDANMGIGFFTGNANGIRSLKNTFSFPRDRGEVHDEGQIIAGAFWDMRVALIERYGVTKGAFRSEELFFRHLLTTDSYRDSYAAVLRFNDDDNNPATPAPDLCLINAAFSSHGLATALTDCKDDPTKFGYKADHTLSFGVASSSEAGLSLMASAGEDARAMKICIGSATNCADTSASGWQALKLDGTLEKRVAFVSAAPVKIDAGSTVWLAAFDEKGDLLGRRALKYANR